MSCLILQMKQAELDLSDARRVNGGFTGVLTSWSSTVQHCMRPVHCACGLVARPLTQHLPLRFPTLPHTGSSKRLQETIQALQLETSSVARALKETTAARERQLVEHDVLKLQVCLT
jgi:hypothetical protein